MACGACCDRRAAERLSAPQADLERVAALIAKCEDTTANLALLGDKNLLFNKERTAFIMYQVSGHSWVAMGDPGGVRPRRGEALAWEFLENCDGMAVSPVFYQVKPQNLPLYIDLGLNLSKLGEEARVPLDAFSLEGRRARGSAPGAPARGPRRRASSRWCRAPRSRGHSAGAARGVRGVARGEEHRGEAFFPGVFRRAVSQRTSIAEWCAAAAPSSPSPIYGAAASNELSVDLMRFTDGAPKGVIDYLLIECMLWGKAQGFQWFNLGMAPLCGAGRTRARAHLAQARPLVQRYGEMFYNFEGLRKYKEKFLPVWRPRYLAAPDGLAIAGALLDVTALISGGVGKVLRK